MAQRQQVYALPQCLMTDPNRYNYHPTIGKNSRLPRPWGHVTLQEPADDLPASLELLDWGKSAAEIAKGKAAHRKKASMMKGRLREDLAAAYGVPPETDEYKELVKSYFQRLQVEEEAAKDKAAKDLAKERARELILDGGDGASSPDEMMLELCQNFPLLYLPPTSPYSKKRDVGEVRHQGFRTRTVDVRKEARQATLSNIGRKPKTKPKSDPDSVLKVPRDPAQVPNPRSPFALVRSPTNPSRAELYKKTKYKKCEIRELLNRREIPLDTRALTYSVLSRSVAAPLALPEHLAPAAAHVPAHHPPAKLHQPAAGRTGILKPDSRPKTYPPGRHVPPEAAHHSPDTQPRLAPSTLTPIPSRQGTPGGPAEGTRAHQLYNTFVKNAPPLDARPLVTQQQDASGGTE
eukprot:TRINITY_DN4549_c0_g1_i1.p1 TRINITY_DN4549_c0_g1~~TRINITY_DN4549_c0_g1_i1.p1  ORF type:complete len:437 (+),score=142.66 TRINITY_DN4549_c0_g1_i1:99-1313(+)